MAENQEENQNEEPIEISVGREDVEKKPEEEQGVPIGPTGEQGQQGEGQQGDDDQGEGASGSEKGEGEGKEGEEGEEKGEGEKSDEPGDKEGEEEGEGEEKGDDGEPKPSDDGEDEGEGEEESEEEKEEREKKEKEKQEKRDQEDKEEKEKRDKEDSEKSPDKKKKEKREKEDQKKKEKRDKEDKKDKQDQRDKKDKSDKEKREQEDKEEQEKRDKEDEKDQQEPDPKKREQKQKDRKEKRASEDWDKKKKREKEDKKKQEKRDKEDKSDSIIGKRVMIVYSSASHLGEIFIVKKLLNTIIVGTDFDEDLEREIKKGDKIQFFECALASDDTQTAFFYRTNFILVDGGDSILWHEGDEKYTNEIKQINIPEKSLGVETEAGVYWVVVDKVLKSIPQTKADKEKKEKEEKEKDDGLFHSLSVVLIKDVVEIFKTKGLAPPTEDTFLVCHFPRRIYSIYKKLLIQDGLNDAELMERTGSSLEDFRELDKYLAKMILKQFQIAGYYYDPAHAFDNILYDNLKVLNVFESKNVLVKRPDSADTISVFRDGKTLSVHSNILGYTFLEDIIFGERKNIVKFDLWKNHKYEKIQELYNFLEFVVSTSRLVSDEDKSILEYEDINNAIANIYKSQLKALENAV